MIKIEVKFIKSKGIWRDVADSCNTTTGKEVGTKNPSSKWITRIIRSEHSPIRQIIFKWKWINLKSWVSTHIVRHKYGIEHWVKTQRSDRTGINRDVLPQGNEVTHECEANIQALINISRKRLCNCAAKETREAWQMFLDSIKNEYSEVYNSCVPDCIYRGWCYEFYSCKYHKTEDFQQKLLNYREGIN